MRKVQAAAPKRRGHSFLLKPSKQLLDFDCRNDAGAGKAAGKA